MYRMFCKNTDLNLNKIFLLYLIGFGKLQSTLKTSPLKRYGHRRTENGKTKVVFMLQMIIALHNSDNRSFLNTINSTWECRILTEREICSMCSEDST